MKPVVLCILDGVGIRNEKEGNAFAQANKPAFDYLWNNFPHTTLNASEKYVGLPMGQMGNSEVGHMNIGAGRIVLQELLKINKSIEEGSFYSNKTIIDTIENCKKNNSNLHIIGLVSDGGIHSHIDHLLALLDICKQEKFDRVYIHAILDGRDTEPMVGPKYIKILKEKIDEVNIGKIITIMGRYYIMNRDRNWESTKVSYEAVINGNGINNCLTTEEAFELEYKENLTDEFMKPTVIEKVPINDNDSIITFNYRSDRMIQLTRAIMDPDFKEFSRRRINPYYTTMTEYEAEKYCKNINVIFKLEDIVNTLGEVISKKGLKQLRLTEFEKRLHVTFYFSGCRLKKFVNEENILIERPDVWTYDEKPEMRAYEITDCLIDSLQKDYSLIVVNYPNGDSVGHTGYLNKAIEAIEHIDVCLEKIIRETKLKDYTLIITADHGNCENMIEPDGTPNKMHTTNKVPFIICDKKYKLNEGNLCDIAPTILDILNMPKPTEMTGKTLIGGRNE